MLFVVPLAYQVNARAATSVESASLALLEKESVHTALARTVDTAWLQFALPDGRLAWVFTDSLQLDRALFVALPLVYTPTPEQQAAQTPDTSTEGSAAESPAPIEESDAETTENSIEEPVEADGAADTTAQTGQAPTAGTLRTHVVANGDFLKQLAISYYGDAELWTLIYSANQDVIGDNPNVLTAGQTLVIPPLE